MTATDTADVTVIHPAITIAKTPDSQQVVSGGTASFTIKVTNSGDVTLTQRARHRRPGSGLRPHQHGHPGAGLDGPEAIVTYTCTLANVTASFTNSATATGTPPVGPDVTATDTADVTVIHPAITVAKTPDSQQVRERRDGHASRSRSPTAATSRSPTCASPTPRPRAVPARARTSPRSPRWPRGDRQLRLHLANVAASFTNSATATGTPAGRPRRDRNRHRRRDRDPPGDHGREDAGLAAGPERRDGRPSRSRSPTAVTSRSPTSSSPTPRLRAAPAPARTSRRSPRWLPPRSSATTARWRTWPRASPTPRPRPGRPPVGPDVTATDTADVTVIHPAITVAKTPDSQQVESRRDGDLHDQGHQHR